MREIAFSFAVFILVSIPGNTVADDKDNQRSWLTRAGYYRVSYESRLQPLVINRIHSWVFHIETANGDAVSNATISVSGGMPNHNHGLPTSPRMTQMPGDGNYLLEGMRFHMAGSWELKVTVEADGRRDSVVIPLTL